MSHPLSVLRKASKADIRSDPFPHIVLQDVLPLDVCNHLIASYPSLKAMGVDEAAHNSRWSYPTRQVMANEAIPDLWKQFVAYHASEAFFHEIVDLFYEDIHRLYPRQFPSYGALHSLRVGIREARAKDQRAPDGTIQLDSQISGNTPVRIAGSVRTTHVDDGRKLFSGLVYMRKDEDDSRGGDLTISRFLPRYATLKDKLKCFEGVHDSLHGVTPRYPTEHCRIFLNVIGELSEPLYETVAAKDGFARRDA